MSRARRGLLALTASVVLVAGAVAPGPALTLSAARRQALSSVAPVARAVPRETGYQVGPCVRVSGSQISCPYRVFIRALSGGTITCTSQVQVRSVVTAGSAGPRTARQVTLSSTFSRYPVCVRKTSPRSGATGGGAA